MDKLKKPPEIPRQEANSAVPAGFVLKNSIYTFREGDKPTLPEVVDKVQSLHTAGRLLGMIAAPGQVELIYLEEDTTE